MTFTPPPLTSSGCRSLATDRAGFAALREIPQRTRHQRDDAVLIQSCRVGLFEPGPQRAPQHSELGQRGLRDRTVDERALTGTARGQTLGLQLLVCLQHGIGIDRQRRHDLPDLGQPVAALQIAQPQRMLDLVDELEIGRYTRGRIKPERDRRGSSSPIALTSLSTVIGIGYRIELHKSTAQPTTSQNSADTTLRRRCSRDRSSDRPSRRETRSHRVPRPPRLRLAEPYCLDRGGSVLMLIRELTLDPTRNYQPQHRSRATMTRDR